MLHVGLDLSRTRLDVHVMTEVGAPVLVTTAAPDAGGLASLAARIGEFGKPVTAAIDALADARGAGPLAVIDPGSRQVELPVDQRPPGRRGVGQEHPDLAVVD